MRRVWPIVLLLSCGGGKDKQPPGDGLDCPPGGTEATWANHGQPFLDTWCTGCHHSALPTELRQGAPQGMDFDTWQGANAWAVSIHDRVVDKRTMPPAGGPSEEGRELLGEWLSCGLPGKEGSPKPACDGPRSVSDGDLTVASKADLDTFCASYDAVGGNLSITGGGDVALDCLCEVGGEISLWQTSGVSSVALPNLESVGGLAVNQTSGLTAVHLPSLLSVGDRVSVGNNSELAALDLSALESVGAGGVDVVANDALDELWLTRLFTVTGALIVRDNPDLDAIALDRILMVGDLVITGNDRLERLYGDAYQLDTVDGDLIVADNPALEGFYGFEELRSVGGTLRLENNDAFEDFFGFTQLVTVGGDLEIRGHQRLGLIDGFDHLESVGGTLRVADNAVMRFIQGFRILADVGVGSGGVDGVRLEGLPALEDIGGLDDLDRVGSLRVAETALTGLEPLHGVTSIEGNLEVVDNPSLPSTAVDTLVATVGAENIGGYVVNSGNAN